MSNIKQLIQIHNRKYLKTKNDEQNETLCNCRTKNKCPLNNKCLVENVMYNNNQIRKRNNKLFGLNGWDFQKKDWNNHINGFKNYNENGTEISK